MRHVTLLKEKRNPLQYLPQMETVPWRNDTIDASKRSDRRKLLKKHVQGRASDGVHVDCKRSSYFWKQAIVGAPFVKLQTIPR